MDEELSLRDIADILGQYKALLLGLPLLLAAIAFGVASFSPKTYTSDTVVALNNTAATAALDPSLLPSVPALAGGYQVAAPKRLAQLWNVEPKKVGEQFGVAFDDKTGAVRLAAQANQPSMAQTRAEQAVNDFVKYANGVTTSVLVTSYRSKVEQTQQDIQSDQRVLKSLRTSLAATPTVLAGKGLSSGRDAAAGAGLDPRFAGNADQAANPAYSFLAVQIAQTEARLASNYAALARLQASLNNPEQLISLARQTTQLNRLADANLPTKAGGLGRGVITLLALLLGALLAVLIAFVHHALRRPAIRVPARRGALTPESDLS